MVGVVLHEHLPALLLASKNIHSFHSFDISPKLVCSLLLQWVEPLAVAVVILHLHGPSLVEVQLVAPADLGALPTTEIGWGFPATHGWFGGVLGQFHNVLVIIKSESIFLMSSGLNTEVDDLDFV